MQKYKIIHFVMQHEIENIFFSHQLTPLRMYTYFNSCLNPNLCVYYKEYFPGQKNVRKRNAAHGYTIRVKGVLFNLLSFQIKLSILVCFKNTN